MRRIACSTWVSCRRCAASSTRCCRAGARRCCSRRPSRRTSVKLSDRLHARTDARRTCRRTQVVAQTVTHHVHPVPDHRKGDLLTHLLLQTAAGAGPRVLPHQARVQPCGAVTSNGRHQGGGDPRQQEPGRPHARARRLQDRPRQRARRHRHRGARARHRRSCRSSSTIDLPLVAEDYVHRAGRTGRAGAGRPRRVARVARRPRPDAGDSAPVAHPRRARGARRVRRHGRVAGGAARGGPSSPGPFRPRSGRVAIGRTSGWSRRWPGPRWRTRPWPRSRWGGRAPAVAARSSAGARVARCISGSGCGCRFRVTGGFRPPRRSRGNRHPTPAPCGRHLRCGPRTGPRREGPNCRQYAPLRSALCRSVWRRSAPRRLA